MSILTLMYTATSIAVILYAGDTLRRIAGRRQLIIALSCVLVCAGALAGLCDAVRHGTTIYNILLPLGVAIYCAHRHRHRGVDS